MKLRKNKLIEKFLLRQNDEGKRVFPSLVPTRLTKCLFLWFCMGKLRSGGEIFQSVGVATFQSWTALRMVCMEPAQGRFVVQVL